MATRGIFMSSTSVYYIQIVLHTLSKVTEFITSNYEF